MAEARTNPVVHVASVAGRVKEALFTRGIERLASHGFSLRWNDALLGQSHPYLAGPEDQRIDELNRAFADPAVSAIICARGGYGSMHLLDGLDVAAAVHSKKVFVGYSDNTALHLALNCAGLPSIHGPVVTALGLPDTPDEVVGRVARALRGTLPRDETLAGTTGTGGVTEGVLVGGNLSLLQSCLSIPGCTLPPDTILLVEEVGEPLYRIDRMITGLRLSGVLAHVIGVAIGSFTRCGDGSPAGEAEAA